jgi:hypothetical protein
MNWEGQVPNKATTINIYDLHNFSWRASSAEGIFEFIA